jgi:hypothetical protein
MLKTGTSIIFVLVFLLCQSKVTANVFADNDSILLTLENASFVPLSNVHGNQVTMSVKYQVNDESLEGEKVNGIMKLYSTNGSLIHSSSFPDGFTAKKKGGTEDFKTTIRDPTIQSLTANVTFTDIKKTAVSNVLTTNLQLKKLSVPVATPDLDNSTNDGGNSNLSS